MLVLTCPWCGPREEIEFRYGGEAGVAAPTPDGHVEPDDVAAFLFFRSNPKGAFTSAGTTATAAGAGSRSAGAPSPTRSSRTPSPSGGTGHELGQRPWAAGGWRTAGGESTGTRPIRFRFDDRVLTGSQATPSRPRCCERRGRGRAQHLPRTAARDRGGRRRGAQRPRRCRAGPGPRRATEVELVEGLAVRSVSGKAPVPEIDDTPGEHVRRHADVVVVGGGRGGDRGRAEALAAGRPGGPAGGRRIRPRPLPESLRAAAGFPVPAADGGDRPVRPEHDRGPRARRGVLGASPRARDRLWHLRARDVVLATGADRAPDRVRRQRPAGDHARGLGRGLSAAVRRGSGAAGRRLHHERFRVRRRTRPPRGRRRRRRDRRLARGGPDRETPTASTRLTGHVRRRDRGRPRGSTTVHVAPRDDAGRRPRDRGRPARRLRRLGPGRCASTRTPAAASASTNGPAHTWPRRRRPNLGSWRVAAAVSSGRAAVRDADPVWLVPAPDGSLDRHFVDLQRDATAADIRRASTPACAHRSTSSASRRSEPATSRAGPRASIEVGILQRVPGREPRGPRTDQLPDATGTGSDARHRRPVPRRSLRPGPGHAHPREPCRRRRRVRERRPVEARLGVPANGGILR